MLFTDVQRSVRLNKKKKSTNTSPYPDEVIDRLARAFYPAILACWNSEEGQREFAAWQAEQAHHIPSKEKQSVPDGERPVVHIAIVCGFFRVRPVGRTLFFLCYTSDVPNCVFSWEESCQFDTIPLCCRQNITYATYFKSNHFSDTPASAQERFSILWASWQCPPTPAGYAPIRHLSYQWYWPGYPATAGCYCP